LWTLASAAQVAVLVLAAPDLRFPGWAVLGLAVLGLAVLVLAVLVLAVPQAARPSMADQNAARDKHCAAAIALTRNPIQVIAEPAAPAAQRDRSVLTEPAP
jgi:hypothetical protein